MKSNEFERIVYSGMAALRITALETALEAPSANGGRSSVAVNSPVTAVKWRFHRLRSCAAGRISQQLETARPSERTLMGR
jgi:hypothetical protein